jgi:hypothetical protein
MTGKLIVSERADNAALKTCAVENTEGKLILCGGMSTKLNLYIVNAEKRKNENA